jgi:hypothetical protein
MEIGDKVIADGMSGIVVALPSEGKYARAYPAAEWSHLQIGVLVDTVEAGLIHFTSLDRIEVNPLSS